LLGLQADREWSTGEQSLTTLGEKAKRKIEKGKKRTFHMLIRSACRARELHINRWDLKMSRGKVKGGQPEKKKDVSGGEKKMYVVTTGVRNFRGKRGGVLGWKLKKGVWKETREEVGRAWGRREKAVSRSKSCLG